MEPTRPLRPPTRAWPLAAVVAVTGLLATGGAVAATHSDDAAPRLSLVSGARNSASSEGGGDSAQAVGNDMSIAPDRAGVEYRVQGNLATLAELAPAWRVRSGALGTTELARIARAFGIAGEPIRTDGGWTLEGDPLALSAFESPDGWSIGVYPSMQTDQGAPAPALPASRAEELARALLDDMGVSTDGFASEAFEAESAVASCIDPAIGDVEPMPAANGPIGPLEREAQGPSGPSEREAQDLTFAAQGVEPAGDPCSDAGYSLALQTVSFFPVVGDVRADWAVWTVALRPDGSIESLNGTWATAFEQAGDYPLRSVEASLAELRSGGGYDYGRLPLVGPPDDAAMEDPTFVEESGAKAETALESGTATPRTADDPDPDPDPVPDPDPDPGPDPADAAADQPCRLDAPTANSAVAGEVPYVGAIEPCPVSGPPTEPEVVTITEVSLGLTLVGAWVDGTQQLHLVPAHRFVGTYEWGGHFELSLIALHPDAIGGDGELRVK